MRESYFTTGIVRCERSRAWWQKALWVLTALLVAWLLSGCEMRGEGSSGDGSEVELEPWLAGCILGLLAAGTVAGVWVVALLMRRGDEEAAESYWGDAESPEPDPDPDTLKREQRTAEPVGEMERGYVLRILESCAEETGHIQVHVQRAQRHLSVEDYGEELLLAEEKLEVLMRCLGELAKCIKEGLPS